MRIFGKEITLKSQKIVTHRGYAKGKRGKPDNPADWFPIHHSNRADFYRYVRDHVPLISASVWAWVRLCLTPQKFIIIGSVKEKARAEEITEVLGRRVFEGISRKDGIKSLLELNEYANSPTPH